MAVVEALFYEYRATHWTLTILRHFSLAMAPIPYILYFYNPWIRK